jgi:predicted nucleic acid-binding protein
MTIFADTFFYLALLNPSDEAYASVVAFTRQFSGKMVTTEWVLTELADALANPADREQVASLIESMVDDSEVIVIPATHELFQRGLDFFKARPDKEWSLTDCISFVVMRDLSLSQAATGDHHFEQAGYLALLK